MSGSLGEPTVSKSYGRSGCQGCPMENRQRLLVNLGVLKTWIYRYSNGGQQERLVLAMFHVLSTDSHWLIPRRDGYLHVTVVIANVIVSVRSYIYILYMSIKKYVEL